MKNPLNSELPPIYVFVGYDDRQHEAYEVCKHSILSRATRPTKVIPLYHKELRALDLYTRQSFTDGDGQQIDAIDKRPFSTQFSFSRFLVPELYRRLSKGLCTPHPFCVFVDCDVVFLRPIDMLIAELETLVEAGTEEKAVYVVKHNYKPPEGYKMDNCKQESYNMKLWSALMVFNMNHPANDALTADTVNVAIGRDLHGFQWLQSPDLIGDIEEAWQFIPDHSEEFCEEIKMLHLTEGGPWFPHMRDCNYADVWYAEFKDHLTSRLSLDKPGLNVDNLRNLLGRTELNELTRTLSS